METKILFVGSEATTNRRLLDKAVLLELKKPWSLLPFPADKFEKSLKNSERSEPKKNYKNRQKPLWWSILFLARTYFEQNPY